MDEKLEPLWNRFGTALGVLFRGLKIWNITSIFDRTYN